MLKVKRLLNRTLRILSIFVAIGDGVVLAYLIAVNILDAIMGKYGSSTSDIVVASLEGAIIALTFYLGIIAGKKQEESKHRRFKVRGN